MMHALRCALSLTLFSLVLGEKGPSGRTPRVLIYLIPIYFRYTPPPTPSNEKKILICFAEKNNDNDDSTKTTTSTTPSNQASQYRRIGSDHEDLRYLPQSGWQKPGFGPTKKTMW